MERSQPGKGWGSCQQWWRKLRRQCAHDVVQQSQQGVGIREKERRVFYTPGQRVLDLEIKRATGSHSSLLTRERTWPICAWKWSLYPPFGQWIGHEQPKRLFPGSTRETRMTWTRLVALKKERIPRNKVIPSTDSMMIGWKEKKIFRVMFQLLI